MNKPEILAPCGSIASLKGAVKAGADAVYIGGSKFGARAYAENPDNDELLSAIDFVHLNGKKIYMTVNTLLKEDEIRKELYDFIEPCYLHGLDAVIVQDLGVLEFLRREFPDLPLHASTQMTVTNSDGANLLKEQFGITRVVPARELTLPEVRRLREGTELEIECFVHGALCYSYSGQCLLSSMIGGRSGNRGRCAQPCRMKYDLLLNNKKIGDSYALSLKDICTLEMLPDLVEAGIDSFKIEGRMKKAEYSAGITACYRKVLEKYFELGKDEYTSYIKNNPDFLSDTVSEAAELYNRGGFSCGYYPSFHGKAMMSTERPNHNGVKVGTVSNNSSGRISIRTSEMINPQDVLEIRGGDTFEFTAGAEGVKSCMESKDRIYEVNVSKNLKLGKGDEVFRTRNNKLLNEINEKYLLKDEKPCVSGILTVEKKKELEFTVYSGSLSFTAKGDVIEEARSVPMTPEKMAEVLKKTGEAEFAFDDLKINCKDNVFVPVGALKKIRREAFSGLHDKILSSFRRNVPDSVSKECSERKLITECNENPGVIVSIVNKEQLLQALTYENVDEVYVDAQELTLKEQTELCKMVCDAKKEAFLVLPRIFRIKEKERYERELTPDGYGLVANSIDEIAFVKTHFPNCKIRLSESLYVTNTYAKSAVERAFGINEYTASVELNAHELTELNLSDCNLIIYGREKVMHTAQCLMDNNSGCRKQRISEKNEELSIRDKTGAEFPVRTLCPLCTNVIYNSSVYSLIGCRELDVLVPKAYVVSFVFEDGNEVKRVLDTFFNGSMLKGEYTKGHIRRGVE